VNEIVLSLNHEPTRLACAAERAFLKGLGGGCLVPIAAYATIEGGLLRLAGLVARPDGSETVRGEHQGAVDDAPSIGRYLADELLSRGANRILVRE
jgi:hydroxymethylbilane synthase